MLYFADYFSVPQMGIPPRPVQGTNVPTAVPVQQQQQMPMQGKRKKSWSNIIDDLISLNFYIYEIIVHLRG